MTEISAKVIADSVAGTRLTTLELTYPRFIHSEFMTHRVFSRNAASSRAIPTEKLIEQVVSDPAKPIEYGKNQSGMQAHEQVDNYRQVAAEEAWLDGRDKAVEVAYDLWGLGVHKQIVNRILEPYVWITVIVSATEWENFFSQRISPMAQPEIHRLAVKMKEAIDASTPLPIAPGGWHIPYVDVRTVAEVFLTDDREAPPFPETIKKLKAISVARCARVSYLNQGSRDIEKDLQLFDRLVGGGHWSPFEHVASPSEGETLGNFVGWTQFRHVI